MIVIAGGGGKLRLLLAKIRLGLDCVIKVNRTQIILFLRFSLAICNYLHLFTRPSQYLYVARCCNLNFGRYGRWGFLSGVSSEETVDTLTLLSSIRRMIMLFSRFLDGANVFILRSVHHLGRIVVHFVQLE